MEITNDELAELEKRGVALWIKIEMPDETLLIEARRLSFVPLMHTVKTDTGQPCNVITGGDVVLINDSAVRSELKRWPRCVRRAAGMPLKDAP